MEKQESEDTFNQVNPESGGESELRVKEKF